MIKKKLTALGLAGMLALASGIATDDQEKTNSAGAGWHAGIGKRHCHCWRSVAGWR